MKLKKHIRSLFNIEDKEDAVRLERLECALSLIFRLDPSAELRVHIHGDVYFIQFTDMQVVREALTNKVVEHHDGP